MRAGADSAIGTRGKVNLVQDSGGKAPFMPIGPVRKKSGEDDQSGDRYPGSQGQRSGHRDAVVRAEAAVPKQERGHRHATFPAAGLNRKSADSVMAQASLSPTDHDDDRDREPAPQVQPFFRPEASQESEFGDAYAFSVPRWRAIGAVAGGGLALLLLFALIADFDRVASVRGVVTPASGVSRLATPQAGIVTDVLVSQGATVRRGQPILRVASTVLLPSGAAAPAERLAAFRRQQRISRDGMAVEVQRAAAERGRISEQIAQLAATARSLDEQTALQSERIASNEERLRNLAPLRERGYVSEVAYQTQRETVLALRQQLADLQQRRAAAMHELGQLRFRSVELAAESRRTGLQSAAALAELERGAAEAQAEAEVTLAAPIAGRIASLHVRRGRNVAASEELVTIVPGGDAIEALLFVPPSAAGSLRRGQPVTLRYDAFPHQRYGVGRGTVIEIASTASPVPGGGEASPAPPAYRVRVALQGNGAPFALRPDMTLSASIIIERRSLLDWLLSPLRERWRERSGDPA